MSQKINVGIHAIGTYLPRTVRKNDWWPTSVVEQWRDRQVWKDGHAKEEPIPNLTEGMRLTQKALASYRDDPFQGAIERHVLGDEELAADMEAEAARNALNDAGLKADDIDLLLSYTMVPDYINAPNCCLVHDKLGLRRNCFSSAVDTVCNSFQTQLGLASQMIASGQIKYALLVQSSAITRITPYDKPFSASFGDGAAAVILGPVGENRGLLGQVHHTDGSLHRALVATVPGQKHWTDEGKVLAFAQEPALARNVFLGLPDRAKEVLDAVFNKLAMTPNDVDFYASHQATAWLRTVTQEYVGMSRARSLDTFPWAGTLSAANLPTVMATASRDGLLKDGDTVAMFSGGTGIVYSSTILRWGT